LVKVHPKTGGGLDWGEKKPDTPSGKGGHDREVGETKAGSKGQSSEGRGNLVGRLMQLT